jgi:hypothetical protein
MLVLVRNITADEDTDESGNGRPYIRGKVNEEVQLRFGHSAGRISRSLPQLE